MPTVEGRGLMTEPHSARGHDPLDEYDDIYDALAVGEGEWCLRDSDTGEEIPVTRQQLAQLLADRRRVVEPQ